MNANVNVPGDLTEAFLGDAEIIHKHAMRSLFEQLDSLCEGAIAVNRLGQVVWINDKYAAMLGLDNQRQALGRDVEELIPNSMLREVMRLAQPNLLDIMTFGQQAFVVTRMPLRDGDGQVIGAVGFVLYEQLNFLKPLVAKFAALQTELAQVKKGLADSRRPKYALDSYVGEGAAIQEAKRQATRAAQQDASVLLLGETGTGKEILASAIHAMSARAAAPFIGVNMAAVPEALLEAEFFGVAPGAFTGADKKPRDGKFKLAHGGTLFLDEIGDMPLSMQGKLLRVLQEQEIEPVGSNTVIKIDVRVIAATSVDLQRLMEEGKFRSDLFFRLNVLPIRLPPLRDCLADLPVLCEALLQRISERNGMARRRLGASAQAVLASYRWPGNVRELGNVLERGCILSDQVALGEEDFLDILPASIRTEHQAGQGGQARDYASLEAEFERGVIRSALAAHGNNVPAAAQQLGWSRAKLYKRIAALGLAVRA